MIKLKALINESLDNPYKYSHSFKTEEVDYEDDETGETYKKDVLSPLQLIKFKTDKGIPYLWYAKRSRYNESVWTIAFGVVEKGNDEESQYSLNIGMTGTGNAGRIFSTVIDIINSFIEFDDDNYEIQRLIFTAKEKNREEFYIKRIVTRIEKFKLENVRDNIGETEITMVRTS
jgi:hypothetical protein